MVHWENMNLLESFRLRNLSAASALLPKGLEFEVSQIGNLEHLPKCSVNISSVSFLCNLTMWSSGECDLLVTDETAQVLINETNLFKTESEMQSYLENAYRRLHSIHRNAS